MPPPVKIPASVLALALVLGAAAGCGPEFTSCAETKSCPGADTVAGAGGGAGEGGEGSASGGVGTPSNATTTTGGATSSSGGSGGSGGAAGDGGGGTTGGSGGTGGSVAVPCDGACEGETPVCDEEADACVECLEASDCDEGVCETDSNLCVECLQNDDCDEGVCDVDSNLCVECLGNGDCEAPAALCDIEDNFCVECLENTDCTDPQLSFCDAGSCTPCQTNDDCVHLTGRTVCDAPVGECVECTGTDYASCGVNDDDEPLVCDSLTRTCSDQVERGSGTCRSCIADAHCPLGHLCVMQTFNAAEVGYFCLWKEGETDNGAPAICNSTSRPYVDQIVDAESIDGQVANLCGLRTSTCPARNEFSSKNCAPEGVPDDSLCGVDPPNDAKCARFSADEYFCTMRCGSEFDCPSGFDCNTTPLEPVCDL